MAANAITILIEAQDSASKTIAGVAENVRQAASKTNEATKGVASTSDSASRSVGGFSTALSDVGRTIAHVGIAFATYQIGRAISDFASDAFTTAASLQQTNMAFESLIGNQAEANRVFGELVQYANVTPFESKDIISASQTLMGFGTSGQQTVDIIKQLGDVVSVSGGNLSQLSLVTGQVFSQGKMRAQDMYQLINDGGAGVLKIMAQNAGGMKNLTDEFDKGGIPAQQYFDAVKQATSQNGFAFEGANKQADTFNGRLSTLKDTVTQFGMKLIGVHIDPKLGYQIDKGGLFDKATDYIKTLNTEIQKLDPAQVVTGIKMGLSIAGIILAYATLRGGVKLVIGVISDLQAAWKFAAVVANSSAVTSSAAWIASAVKTAAAWVATQIGTIASFVAMAASSAAQAVVSSNAWIASSATASSAVTALRVLVASPVAMGAIAVAGALADIALVMQAVQSVRSAIQAMNDAKSAINNQNGINSSLKGAAQKAYAAGDKAKGDQYMKIANSNNTAAPTGFDKFATGGGFALGTNFAPGGPTWVGENGPELVNLPTGSKVHTAKDSAAMAGGGTTINITGNITIESPEAAQAFWDRIDKTHRLSRLGMGVAS